MDSLKLKNSLLLHIYFTLFAISGVSGLIYESIWTHYLKLFLGHAAYAQTLVLVIFMGGLALGAWLASRYSRNFSNLLLSYAFVEGVIGIFALIFHSLFINTTELAYTHLIPNLTSVTQVTLLKWALAALLILPQSILLGSTFPLMSAGIIRRFPATPGHSLAVLYFANSLGAAIGILVSGFVLIEMVGLPGTILTAGLINLVLALIVWLLCHDDSPITSAKMVTVKTASSPSSPLLVAFLLVAAFTGLSSFLYEIGWIRMLSLVLGSSTHAFELMLSAFILGLALGGYWLRRRIDNFANPLSVLGWIQIAMGLLALSTLLSYGHTFNVMQYMLTAFTKTDQGYTLFNLSSHGIAMLLMLPATICAGMTLPLLTYQLLARGHGEKAIGGIYAANTLGAIIGVVLGVQLIMPTWGVKNLITIGGGIDILLGLALLWYASSPVNKFRWAMLATTTGAAVIASVWWIHFEPMKMASGVFRYGQLLHNIEILYHRDGKTASVDLYRHGGEITISTNGKPDAALNMVAEKVSIDEPTMILLAVLPVAIDANLKTAAVIGLGSGLTTHTLLTMPTLERVDTIEIEPAIIEAAKGFGAKVAHTFEEVRSHLYVEDAKTFFTNQQKIYDLIISEPSNPWVSGVAGLFSEEFYQRIRTHLSPDGLLVQWFHLYEMDMALIASILKAMSPHFADYVIYGTAGLDIIIVAKKEGQVSDPTDKIFSWPELTPTLARIDILHKQDLLLRKIANKQMLQPLFNSYQLPANSDYFPILDLGAVKARYLQKESSDLIDLRLLPFPLVEVVTGAALGLPMTLPVTETIYTVNARARQAQAIYQYFQWLADSKFTPTIQLNHHNLILIREVRSWQEYSCPLLDNKEVKARFETEMQTNWLPALHSLQQTMLPFLSSQEMLIIWQAIDSAPCWNDLPVPVKDMLNLYKAISQRQFEQILPLTTRLLPKGPIISSAKHDYLMMASLLAHIALHQPTAAKLLWERYTTETEPSLELRWLVAVALHS